MDIPVGERAVVERLLTLARLHLGTEVAWASLLIQGRQLIVATSGEAAAAMNVTDTTDLAADGSYCVRVLAGQLPPVIADARRNLITRDLDATRDLRIGSYAGLPWRTPDGAVGGMVCCVSRHADPGLADRSLEYLLMVAEMLGDLLSGRVAGQELAHHVETLFIGDALRTVFQPAYRLSDGAPAGVEALARFDPARFATPDRAFATASRFDRGVDLELHAVRRALSRQAELPDDLIMCVNLSADALLDPRVQELLLTHPGGRLGVEVTEHVPVADYLALISVTERLRHHGISIVIDDAGAGYASLNHILKLQPEIIKLDIALVRDIDRDQARQALTRSLVSFAAEIGAALVAEGIETPAQLATLRRLGVGYGQGYLLSRPDTMDNLLATGRLDAGARAHH
jgi:EAL domain-containing protein (putative c-di-GMP-specific phosphodiesterase class I)